MLDVELNESVTVLKKLKKIRDYLIANASTFYDDIVTPELHEEDNLLTRKKGPPPKTNERIEQVRLHRQLTIQKAKHIEDMTDPQQILDLFVTITKNLSINSDMAFIMSKTTLTNAHEQVQKQFKIESKYIKLLLEKSCTEMQKQNEITEALLGVDIQTLLVQ